MVRAEDVGLAEECWQWDIKALNTEGIQDGGLWGPRGSPRGAWGKAGERDLGLGRGGGPENSPEAGVLQQEALRTPNKWKAEQYFESNPFVLLE